MIQQVFIRADGGSTIGLGHLVRCLALAQMLEDQYDVHFFSLEIPKTLSKLILEKGFNLTHISTEGDFINRLSGNEIVVLDHYGLDSNYQKEIKARGNRLVCIDDLHNGTFYSDLIINHAPGINPEKYSAQSYTRYALGLDYALLRPSFLKKINRKEKTGKINRVFVCFGGSDPNNFTLQAINSLLEFSGIDEINVVTGASFTYAEELIKVTQNQDNIKWHQNLSEVELAQLMKTSDMAIVPCSGIMLEAMACGLKIITCYYVDNQELFYKNVLNYDRVLGIGKADDNFTVKLKQAIKFKIAEQVTDGNVKNPFIDSKKNILSKFSQL